MTTQAGWVPRPGTLAPGRVRRRDIRRLRPPFFSARPCHVSESFRSPCSPAAPRRASSARLPLASCRAHHAPAATESAITPADLMTRLYIIADDSMLGREAGTIGNVKVTNYVAREMERMGLRPGGENGTCFQTVPVIIARIDSTRPLAVDGAALEARHRRAALPRRARVGALPKGATTRSLDGAQAVYGGQLGGTLIDPRDAAGKLVVFTVPVGARTAGATGASSPGLAHPLRRGGRHRGGGAGRRASGDAAPAHGAGDPPARRERERNGAGHPSREPVGGDTTAGRRIARRTARRDDGTHGGRKHRLHRDARAVSVAQRDRHPAGRRRSAARAVRGDRRAQRSRRPRAAAARPRLRAREQPAWCGGRACRTRCACPPRRRPRASRCCATASRARMAARGPTR